MFKIRMLQVLYDLSYERTEYQIGDRLSFMCFISLDLHQRISDPKTIWVFHEMLGQVEDIEVPFAKFDTPMAARGLQACGGQFIEASLILVPKQRNGGEENTTMRADHSQVE